jgi:DNA polymerase III subunit delta'
MNDDLDPMIDAHSVLPSIPEALRKSLERDRLAHAYLFTGSELEVCQAALALAKTLHCTNPPMRNEAGVNLEYCNECSNCRDVDRGRSQNTHWIRPSSRLRMITIQQMRDLSQEIFLSPMGSPYKVGVIESAERMNREAANTFLKTLEEPPKRSVLILTTSQPDAVLDTLLSRCQRVACSGVGLSLVTEEQRDWTRKLSSTAMANHEGLFSRYRFLDDLLQALGAKKESIQEAQMEASPLSEDLELEAAHRKKLEAELSAIVEAEYRKSRESLIQGLTFWLRDVWAMLEFASASPSPDLNAKSKEVDLDPASEASLEELLYFPELSENTRELATRINAEQALKNLEILEIAQARLATNAQEGLTLETALLQLRF